LELLHSLEYVQSIEVLIDLGPRLLKQILLLLPALLQAAQASAYDALKFAANDIGDIEHKALPVDYLIQDMLLLLLVIFKIPLPHCFLKLILKVFPLAIRSLEVLVLFIE
jgi:hypothetical protein